MNQTNASPPYEIGLALAGAVSAGAYSAGVLDFLLEALDRWETAKQERPDEVPTHDVTLKVIAGSSAGGMTGVAALGALTGGHTPITSLPHHNPTDDVVEANPLYAAWVEQIDIAPLLGNRDQQDPNRRVTSLLDSTVLDEIADAALDVNPDVPIRPYVADPFHLLLTVTNLKGIPYDIRFRGPGETAHTTAQHADYKEFLLTREDPASDALTVNPDHPDAPAWDRLKQYGLATGAFPGGLEPRRLTRRRSDYDRRTWSLPLRPGDPTGEGCWRRAPISPAWDPDRRAEEEYEFLAVDGGAMNNEPFELARETLAGDDGFNPRTASEAHRSVIMVDPLPTDPFTGMSVNDDIVSVFTSLFDGLMTQARFKPDELMLAQDPDVHSRYLVRPVRRDATGTEVRHPIASEMLNGFGGFLKNAFRRHDFQLGRRNCQRFLQKYFAIPKDACSDNPVFAQYSEAELDQYSFSPPEAGDDGGVMPIIPLVGPLDPANEDNIEETASWETLQLTKSERRDLRARVRRRTRVVSDSMIEQYAPTWYVALAAKAGSFLFRDSIVNRIMDTIEATADDYGLLADDIPR